MHKVRPARLEEIPLLVGMMREFYAESDYPLDLEWAAASFKMLLANAALGAVFLSYLYDEPAGYLVLTTHFSMEFGGLAATIDDLYVRPKLRRRGVAQSLLTAAIKECGSHKVLSLQVEVGAENIAANALYRSHGLCPRTDERIVLVRDLKAAIAS